MLTLGFLNPENIPTEEARRPFPMTLSAPHKLSWIRPSSFSMRNRLSSAMTTNQHSGEPKAPTSSNLRAREQASRCLIVSTSGMGTWHWSRRSATEQKLPILPSGCWPENSDYGESTEGNWTSDKFMKQMEMAVKIAEVKYPKEEGWRHMWIFDHSSCHGASAEDSLDVSRMNVNPGGKRVMRDGWWGGGEATINELC